MTDYEEIQDLIARYSHAVDTWDPEAYAALYTEDGSLTEEGSTVKGRAKLHSLIEQGGEAAARASEGARHIQMTSTIDIKGDRATARTYLVTIALSEQGWRIRGGGTYVDEIVRDADGRWRFESREVHWYRDSGPDPLHPEYGEGLRDLFDRVMRD